MYSPNLKEGIITKYPKIKPNKPMNYLGKKGPSSLKNAKIQTPLKISPLINNGIQIMSQIKSVNQELKRVTKTVNKPGP